MALTLTGTGQGGVFTLRGGSFGGRFQTSVTPPSLIDPDAQAFFSRVTTAGGTLSAIEQSAINTLTTSLKSAGLWTLMKAIYPMVGASAAACAQNLKSSSFTGTFSSGWTFASDGVTPNGTSAFMDTGLNTSTELVRTSSHLSIYVRNNPSPNQPYDIGNSSGTNNTILITRYSNNLAYFAIADNGSYSTNAASTDSRGFFCGTRITNTQTLYKNGTQIVSNVGVGGSLANMTLYIGASNNNGTAALFSNKQYAFATIGNELSSTQVSDFYTAVQAFQTTLSRQV